MFPSRPVSASETADVLASLPSEYRVIDLDNAQFIVGPAGAFVVASAATNVPLVATVVVQRALRLRTALAERLAWVPFIDALVVADDRSTKAVAATTVPIDLLAKTIVQDNPILSEETVATVASLVETIEASTAARGGIPA